MAISFRMFIENRVGLSDKIAGNWGKAGAGVLMLANDMGKWLVGLRSPDVREPNTWGTVGGKIEEGEHPQQAASREFMEETGYKGPVKLYKSFVYQSPAIDQATGKPKFVYHNFIGELTKGNWEPNKNWETAKFEWVTYPELMVLSPKHYGLSALLEHSGDMIRKMSQRS